ncbi:MAG TPA: Uma2 family endonuclease [Isosphaeraceae bacterium]|nr:Uma2 family endonuclease [Isosphaeraceae bacterium]
MATDQHHILRLGKLDEGRYLSSEEFASAEYEEPWRYERIDGRLVIVSPAREVHQDSSEPWRDRLVIYKIQNPDVVQKVVSEAWIRVNDGTDRIGDIGIYLKSDKPQPPIPDRVPELIFEIVSPGRVSRERDYLRKRADYHRLGVREYVVIDPLTRKVTVFRWDSDGYVETVLTRDDVYTSPLLRGLVIPLTEVLSESLN